jgi:serralysin
MGIFSVIQTLWSTDVATVTQSTRVISSADGSQIWLHDPVNKALSSVSLDAGLIGPGDISHQFFAAGENLAPLIYDNRLNSVDTTLLARLQALADQPVSEQIFLGRSGLAADHVSALVVSGSSGDVLLLAQETGDGISAYSISGALSLSQAGTIEDTAVDLLSGISAMAAVDISGKTMVIAASAGENGVSVLELGASGNLSVLNNLGPADNLPVAQPSAITTLTNSDGVFVLLTSRVSSSLTVLKLDADGALTVTDQLNDDLNSRFGAARALDYVVAGDQTFVAAAGTDGGVSLFQLLPDGRLFLRETISDSAGTALWNITGLEFAGTGGRIELFVTATGEGAGITRLSLDLSTVGQSLRGASGSGSDDVIMAASSGGTLSGGGGDDIFSDGAGVDVFWGGDGADSFIFRPDGTTDTVADFDLSRDRIDLSAYGLAYSLSAIDFVTTSTGAELTLQEDSLVLISADGNPIRVEDFTDLMLFNADHVVPSEPQPGAATDILGDAADNLLSGTDGADAMFGFAGDDTFAGSAGSDLIDGGDGVDMVSYELSSTSVYADLLLAGVNIGPDAVGDTFIFVENLRGSVGTDDLRGDGGANMIVGGLGNDFLMGRDGSDNLIGSRGNDILSGGTGDDVLNGGIGNDRLVAGTGNDRLVGAQGDDTLIGSSGDNSLIAGAGEDTIYDGIGSSTLSGGNGADRLIGNSGNDRILGDGGNDRLSGGNGNDRLSGGTGNDYLVGGGGADIFVFQHSSGSDTVEDFTLGLDRLFIDSALVNGESDAGDLVAGYARLSGNNAVLDFGAGDQITLVGLTDLVALVEDILIT